MPCGQHRRHSTESLQSIEWLTRALACPVAGINGPALSRSHAAQSWFQRSTAPPLREEGGAVEAVDSGRLLVAAVGMVADQRSAGSTGSASDQGTFLAVGCASNGRPAESSDQCAGLSVVLTGGHRHGHRQGKTHGDQSVGAKSSAARRGVVFDEMRWFCFHGISVVEFAPH